MLVHDFDDFEIGVPTKQIEKAVVAMIKDYKIIFLKEGVHSPYNERPERKGSSQPENP